jgi:hypothetical protein
VSAFTEHVLGKGEHLLVNCKLRVLHCLNLGTCVILISCFRGYVTVMAGHVLVDNY